MKKGRKEEEKKLKKDSSFDVNQEFMRKKRKTKTKDKRSEVRCPVLKI